MKHTAQNRIRKPEGHGESLALLLLCAALGLGVWRCFFTFCWSDESFYLSTVHRFWLGDAPFRDEWNTGQLYSVLLLPFYSLWRAVRGTTEGIYLAARLTAVGLTFIEAVVLWRLMRPRYPVAALASALMVFFYTKAGLGGLSYYTVCFLCWFGGLLLLYGAATRHWQGGALAASALSAGVLMALAVVCMPFLALLWLAVLPVLLLRRFRPLQKAALWLLAGAVLAAAGYLTFVLSRVSLAEILENLPYVLSDPDSNPVSLPVLVVKFFAQPFYQLWPGAPLWGGALAVTAVLCRPGKTPGTKQKQWLTRAALAGFVFSLTAAGAMLGRTHLALCLLGVQLWLFREEKNALCEELLFFGVGGVSFSFVWQLGSNTGFSGMTLGFAVACPFGAAALEQTFRENNLTLPLRAVKTPEQGVRRGYGALCLLLALAVMVTGWQRLALEYRDTPITECDTRLTAGPAAGLYTGSKAAAQYEALCETVTGANGQGPLLISALAPWAYLCTDRPVAAPTTWRLYTDSVLLEEYYKMYPERQPQTVVLLKAEMGAYVSTIQPEENPAPNTPAGSGFLMEPLQTQYEAVQTPVGQVYQR